MKFLRGRHEGLRPLLKSGLRLQAYSEGKGAAKLMHVVDPVVQGAPVRTLKDFRKGSTVQASVRRLARDAVISALSLVPRASVTNWIRFPYYHYVFDDERAGFATQLRWFRDQGEFVSLDDAVACLRSGDQIDGRYFCITFDDGFRNCLTNAVPALAEIGATAAFFLTTGFIDSPIDDPDVIQRVSNGGDRLPEFLSWDECRAIAAAGMTIGSHTVSHLILSALSEPAIERQLRDSKATIEREVINPCDHFSCPRGRPGFDFIPERDPAIAERVGYRSFLTAQRGSVHRRSQPFLLERDHLLAEWGTAQLRYFFSR